MTEKANSLSRERRPAGRPAVLPDIERRQRILTAAEDIFFAQGYAATSMDDIARACGMSKKTIYRFFDGKLALFSELVDAAIGGLSKYATGHDRQNIDGESVLRAALTDMSKLLLNPRQIALARMVIAEVPHAPEIGESIRDRGIDQAEKIILDVLATLHRQGLIRQAPTLDLSRILIGAVMGDLPFKMLIGLSPPPTEEQIEDRVDRLFALTRGDLFDWAVAEAPSRNA